MSQRYPVGIDLGTTFSSISYANERGRVETVRLEDGAFALASAVYFSNAQEVIVGSEALNHALIDASRVARAFKRHMCDHEWSFRVDDKEYRAEELSAMVLKKLIQQATPKIGPIEEVVISVPFMFDERGRRATDHAGRIAGVRVLDIVNEPVAAALAYGHRLFKEVAFYRDQELKELFGDGIILVYDLGGGTFDLTLMRLGGDYSFEVLAADGDHALGGEDWDQVLSEHLACQYHDLFHLDPRNNPELLQELRIRATEAKISLSELPRVVVELAHGEDRKTVEVLRGDFERMTAHLVDRTRLTLESMLGKLGKVYNSIDFILLIGGSCRMKMIGKMLDRETGRTLDMSLPPDTAVSTGAALFAALKSGHPSMSGVTVKTVNSHALGLVAYSMGQKKYVNHVLINSNEPTQTEVKWTYSVKPGAAEIQLIVLQGDLPDPTECVKLGEASIPNLNVELLRDAKVEVTFSFQENGLLQVKGVVVFSDGRPPIAVDLQVKSEGDMSEGEVVEAETALAGIAIE